ncbi:hypothetical protein BDW_13955 [Bdellovibrio bacteriovorus W]|nr:hypothetical protein BDW_13955 [Bdellovibrio bacteriovorus W]
MASYFCRTRGNKVYLYRQDYKNGKKKDVYIKASDWHLIGFKNTGSTEGNLRLVQDLNEKNRETKEIDSRLRAAERANREITANGQYTPEDDVRDFHQRVKAEFFGTEKYFCKVICHIEFVLKMVAKLKIFPEKYSDNSKQAILIDSNSLSLSIPSKFTHSRLLNPKT